MLSKIAFTRIASSRLVARRLLTASRTFSTEIAKTEGGLSTEAPVIKGKNYYE